MTMAIKFLFVFALGTFLMACFSQDETPSSKPFVLVIDNAHAPRQYPDGFTCFLALIDQQGDVYIPMRFALSPRKGFMDAVHMERRVQNPIFWASDAMRLSFEVESVPSAIIVGHKLPEAKDWSITIVEAATLTKLENGEFALHMAFVEQAKNVSPATRTETLKSLEEAQKEYAKISDSEP